jgi:parvulin-like peptidyl-prolyl isomerase
MKFATLISLLAALAGCGRPSEPLVARGKGVAIRTADVRAKIEALPPAQRERYASRDAVRALVDDLVLGELLARAAEQAGFKNETGDPAGKKRMVQALLVKRFADPEGAKAIPEDELRRAYEEHRSEYVQPLKLGVLHLFLDAPAARRSGDARALARRSGAHRRRREGGPDSPFAFAAIAREVSEEPGSREQGGDLGQLSKEDLARRFSPEIAEGVAGAGNRTSDVLASDRGFHILKLNGGTPP